MQGILDVQEVLQSRLCYHPKCEMAQNAHARAHQQIHVVTLIAVVRANGLVPAAHTTEGYTTALWTAHWCQ
jgi:hypothetical protein